jgi:DNA end-binding protein Ku
MPRAIWSGVINFGMVSIPVKLYTATESKDISFHQIHKECGSRIRQLRWCPVCDREVEYSEIAKGFEYSKDEHVLLDDEDFEKLPLPSRNTIAVTSFVKAEEIDPIYYEKSYYLEPAETGVKPFALLMKAIQKKELTAVAQIAIRNKERLCALRPYDGTLMMDTLYYPDEIRAHGIEGLDDVEVSDKELSMAFTLIDVLEEPFDPTKYSDEYRSALMQIIEAKLEGQEIVAQPAAKAGKVIDLMSALKESVEAAKKAKASEPEGEEVQVAARTASRRRRVG